MNYSELESPSHHLAVGIRFTDDMDNFWVFLEGITV